MALAKYSLFILVLISCSTAAQAQSTHSAITDPQVYSFESGTSLNLEQTSASAKAPADLALVRNALAALGVQYKMGGRSDLALDCSGFIKQVYERTFGSVLPPTAKLISQVGAVIKVDELKVGDLIFFNTLRRPFSHVGMYLGGNRFIHASSKAKQVKIDTLDGYYQQRIDGYRRIARQ